VPPAPIDRVRLKSAPFPLAVVTWAPTALPPAPGDRGGSGAADARGATNTCGDGGAKGHPGYCGAAGADRVAAGRPPRVGDVAAAAPPPRTYHVPLLTINGGC